MSTTSYYSLQAKLNVVDTNGTIEMGNRRWIKSTLSLKNETEKQFGFTRRSNGSKGTFPTTSQLQMDGFVNFD